MDTREQMRLRVFFVAPNCNYPAAKSNLVF